MSAIYGFASDIYNEYVSASIKFDKLVLFSEASRSEYSIDCNQHLCKKCLKSGEHKYHYKIVLVEIAPSNKILSK